MEKFVISFRDKTYLLSVGEFPKKAEVDDLLKIDITNIVGELVSFPAIMNKLGVMLANVERDLMSAELDFDVWQAKYEEEIRKRRAEEEEKQPTVKELENLVISNPIYKEKKMRIIDLKKLKAYINSVYWSAKEKQENLKKISLTLKDGDIDSYLVEKSNSDFNIVNIKKVKKNLIE